MAAGVADDISDHALVRVSAQPKEELFSTASERDTVGPSNRLPSIARNPAAADVRGL
jgi:hypothetical protein